MANLSKLERLIEKSNYALLGARVCVSTKNPNQIIEEINDKYKTGEETFNFIESRFLKSDNYFDWHLSPLGLIWIRYLKPKNLFKAQGLYSLRHLVEELIQTYKDKPQRVKELLRQYYKNKRMEKVREFEVYTIDNNLVYCLKDDKIKPQEIYIREELDGLGYYIIWEGVSRVATHQLVRHQSFDYQQQSQRYINYKKKLSDLTGFYLPPSIVKDQRLLEKYLDKVKRDYQIYKKLVREGIKPEDSRYLIPQSFTSRIIFFAPKDRLYGRDGIKEFIEKRKNHGQHEIREFAKKLEEILK